LREKDRAVFKNTKLGDIINWLKLQFLGESKEESPVDTQFFTDLSDIRTVGRYEIIGRLGKGSMGAVYLGRDPYIDRKVSVKISRPSSNALTEQANKYREQFFLEAQSAGRLVHNNIVAIYDAGMYKDFCYITMEYIDGPTLVKYCKKDSLLPVHKAIEIIYTASKALDFAHKQDVIHRDIKPSNIMLTKGGDLKITDFGIAHIKTQNRSAKGIIGSPSYMSPEQVKEEPIDDKSDIFSLGCVLYELLTGEKAFFGDNYFSVLYKITNDEPVPVRSIRPELPDVLDKITKKSLEKDPLLRYQSCMDFAYDLRVALRGLRGETRGERTEDVADYINNVPFFENFTKEQVQEIMNASQVLKVKKGQVVLTEGEIDDSFFIILSGSVAVKRTEKNIATITRGECFGEMAYLQGQSRMATILAETDCILLKISGTLLDKSSESIQLLFQKNFATTLVKRLSKTN
jgi:serine/threonine-protein kinase